MHYWPEVDGLRTIAVLSVFLFHLNRALLPGGFVGVDIFFVISGFLITLVLLGDHHDRSFSFIRFYQRRIARIVPAGFLVLAVVMVLSTVIYNAEDAASNGANALFAALSIVNVKYIFQSYFEVSPDSQPLLHYWSLSVEEQFYFLFPALLLVIYKFRRIRFITAAALMAASYATCIYFTHARPTWAFYLLPMRAWELLAGALVAMIRHDGWVGTAQTRALLSWGGLILVGLSLVIIREDISFPGWIAALPVAGTAAVLATAGEMALGLRRLLGSRPMVFVGKRSYSLYLWHWPAFSLLDYALFLGSPWLRVGLKVVVPVILTLLTFAFVEQPARRFLNRPRNALFGFLAFALGAGLICLAGYQIRTRLFMDPSVPSIASGGITINPGQPRHVVLIGDSEAIMYAVDLEKIARAQHFTLNVVAKSAFSELPEEERTLWPTVRGYLDKTRPDLVIANEAWHWKSGRNQAQLAKALAELRSTSCRLILISQAPILPKGGTRQDIIAYGLRPIPDQSDPVRVSMADRLRRATTGQITVIDPRPAFVDDAGNVRLVDEKGRYLFQDTEHPSSAGTARLREQMAQAIENAMRQPACH